MDSTNPYTRPSNFTDLLNSQQDSGLPVPSSYESFSHGGVLSSQIPMFSSQPSETASFCEDSPTEKKERKKQIQSIVKQLVFNLKETQILKTYQQSFPMNNHQL